MLGKTNACVGGSSGGSGDTVTAINKTGAVINEGDKVWMTRDVQVATSGYQIGITNSNYGGILSPSGNFVVSNKVGYSVTADAVTKATDFSYDYNKGVVYMDDNSVFACENSSYRVDEKAQYNIGYKRPLAKDIFTNSTGNAREFYQIDLSNGSVLKTWTSTISSSYWTAISQAMVNGKIYQLRNDSSYRYKITLNDDLTTAHTGYTYENGGREYPVGTTRDNKYIICSTSEYRSGAYLRLVEVINEDHLRLLPQSEMPEDLQEFYSATECAIVFNPYTGILTVSSSNAYVIMKYENGVWTKLPIDLGLGDKTLSKFITVSDDLTRACYDATEQSANVYSYIANISNTSGYTALPYRFYNINKDSLVGKAMGSADIDKSFEVSTVLPDNVSVTVTSEDNVDLTME